MKTELLSFKRCVTLSIFIIFVQALFAQDLCQYVDPFIGTDYTGHTYPAATTPYGMVQAGPDTGNKGWEYCSGYHSTSKYIQGFSHTHLSGTGCGDMGDILIMPVVGDVELKAGDNGESYHSSYSHDTEVASPGYYKVYLESPKVMAEMSATPRAALHRYTYPKQGVPGVVIDLEHGISDKTTYSYMRIIDDHTVVGMRRSSGFIFDHRYFFCARFSKPISHVKSMTEGILTEGHEALSTNTKMLLQFVDTDHSPLLVKIGLSTATEQGAIKNLDAEIPAWDFQAVKAQAENSWNKMLSRIEIDAMDNDHRVSFYTSLYHSLLMPNLVTDVDGSYCGWDGQLHKSMTGGMYTNFSFWDTYRAQHPFLALMYPDMNARFVNSLVERHRQTGLLVTNEYGLCETWCMIGNHAVPVIADAYLKGERGFDVNLAYEAVKHALTSEHNKSDWSNYDRYGYFPFDKSYTESVSRTLEDAYDDYSAAQMAKSMGKQVDYDFFMKRAGYYKNLFDSSTEKMRPRGSQRQWREPFNPFAPINEEGKRDYTEGNAWQYTWYVQHDPMGLISLFPSKQKFVETLDTLFTINGEQRGGTKYISDMTGLIGTYSHGNEPSHHVAYLYTLADRPDRTAEVVREVFDRFYLTKRDGLCGNDDCGQMSAWYMFSAMGFYPVNPVGGEYVFGAPQAHRITLHLPNGKMFSVVADKLSVKNKYVRSVRLNGKKIPLKTIRYDDIKDGGTLQFQMSAQP